MAEQKIRKARMLTAEEIDRLDRLEAEGKLVSTDITPEEFETANALANKWHAEDMAAKISGGEG